MTHLFDPNQAQQLDEALKALPVPRAPHTLLPRVMFAARQAAMRPWYTREWFAWPRVWQVASVAALLLLVAGGSMLLPVAQETAGTAAFNLERGVVQPAGDAAQQVGALVRAADTVWQTLLQPVVSTVLLLCLLMASICVVLGAAISRVALGGAFQS